jgi:HAD superfamily hydrolase (TIGR01509 family)
MIEAILFDFDGVLADVNIERVLATDVNARFFKIPPQQILQHHFYHNPRNFDLDLGLTTVEIVRAEMQDRLWAGELEDWMKWWAFVEDSYEVSAEMQALLADLRPNYRLGIITDNHIGFRCWLEGRPDIHRHFDSMVCSAELGVKKPGRLLFEAAITQLGASFETTVYIDNDINNVRAAQKLNINSIHFVSCEDVREQLKVLIDLH